MSLSLGKKIASLLLLCVNIILAQNSGTNILGQNMFGNTNVVTTTVPFLLISPDARANGMGDAGVASEPDANSTHWNPAKLAFVKDTFGFSVSYLPWLRQLVSGINFSYLSFYYKLPANQTLGASLRYFSYNNIQFTNNNGVRIGNFSPDEFALDLCYSRKFGNNWSIGFSGRYIYSDLVGSSSVQGVYTQIVQDFCVDLSAYHKSNEINILGKSSFLSEGICISNIGPKIFYSNSGVSNFIPTNLRLGAAFTTNLNPKNELTITEDVNKLLVPTPPIYALTPSTGTPMISPNGQPVILAGMDPNVSVLQGMVQSFYDAPGGAQEEFNEITWSTGIEYSYNNRFMARTGFFYENVTKGGRQYYTVGAGFRLLSLSVDAAYFIPVSQQNPLQNTLCISLSFNFSPKKKAVPTTS
jgi:hypothetical protein